MSSIPTPVEDSILFSIVVRSYITCTNERAYRALVVNEPYEVVAKAEHTRSTWMEAHDDARILANIT